LKKEKRPSFLWLYVVLGVLAIAAGVWGWHLVTVGQMSHDPFSRDFGWIVLGSAAMALVIGLSTLPLALGFESARKSDLKHEHELLTGLNERLDQVCLLLNLMTENQLISDRTKSVAFRDKDRDAVRRAVQEEIARQDWEAALALVNEIDNSFGYKHEAENFRKEINDKRQSVAQRQISEQMAAIDRYTNAEAWGQALAEAQRVMPLFPNDEQVQRLPQEIENRRQARKKKLMDSWQEAVKNHDVDGSIEILKHLDLYLTPAEAEGLQESARGVLKEKINLLRSKFSEAVQEHRWAEAVRLGDTIISEFPNTRMAQEVRDTMEMLRQRAGTENVAKAGA
jgi:hypothetical protein